MCGEGAFLVLQYNDNGSLDTSFGTNGTVLTEFGPGNDLSFSSFFQSDGKLVLAELAQALDGNQADFAVARYLFPSSSLRKLFDFDGDGRCNLRRAGIAKIELCQRERELSPDFFSLFWNSVAIRRIDKLLIRLPLDAASQAAFF